MAVNAVLSDPLPAGTTFVSLSAPAGWITSTPPVGSAGTVTATKDFLAVGGPFTFTLVVKVPANYSGSATISNTATITAINNSSTNNTATTTTSVSKPGAPAPVPGLNIGDPVIAKSVDQPLARPGETVTFTITVTNPSGTAMPGVVVDDPLPAPLQFVGATTTQGTFSVNGNAVNFQIGTLNPGQTVTMTIAAKVPDSVTPPMDVVNTATVNGRVSASATVHIINGVLPGTGEHP